MASTDDNPASPSHLEYGIMTNTPFCLARHSAAVLLACAAALAPLGAASAQEYPAKPIHVVNPWPPGGSSDAIARPIMARLAERIGQPVVFENKSGASGSLGTSTVARAKPDGYTMLIADVTPLLIVPALRTDLSYDSKNDFEPVTQMTSAALVLVVRSDIPAKNVQELVAYAKERPGKLSFASAGNGSITHLAGEMFMARTGIQALHVPFQGQSPTLTALMGGQVDMGFLNASGIASQLASDKLRALAVTTPKRYEEFPDLPTVAETYPGFEAVSWYGLVVPKGTPADIVARLNKEVVAVLREPEMASMLKSRGVAVEGTSTADFRAKIEQDSAQWTEVVKRANITLQ